MNLGLVADPRAGLALLGPLPPGESTVALEYRLPASGEQTRFRRRLAVAVPLLSVFVADAGNLRLESERLHRRRPVRTPDRTYAQFEAFEVAPEEEVSLRLGTLPPRTRLSRSGVLLLFGVVTAVVIGSIVAPLRGLRERDEADGELETASRREREALYAAIRDLEHDHETQKIDDEDYAVMRDDLRSRAVALLREEREAASASHPLKSPAESERPQGASPTHTSPAASEQAPLGRAQRAAGERSPEERPCPACDGATEPSHRFCPHCGASLASPPESEASA